MSVYCVLLLHNTVPHMHAVASFHPENEQADHQNHHHHGNHHGHGDVEAEHEGLLGFLVDFLGGIDHEDNDDGHLTWYLGEHANLQLNAADLSPMIGMAMENTQTVTTRNIRAEKFHHPPPPLLYRSPLLSTPSLRGPPSLV